MELPVDRWLFLIDKEVLYSNINLFSSSTHIRKWFLYKSERSYSPNSLEKGDMSVKARLLTNWAR